MASHDDKTGLPEGRRLPNEFEIGRSDHWRQSGRLKIKRGQWRRLVGDLWLECDSYGALVGEDGQRKWREE